MHTKESQKHYGEQEEEEQKKKKKNELSHARCILT